MRLFLESLVALLPPAAADVERVFAMPEPQRWDALYYKIILPHLVYNKEYDREAVHRARVLWFRYVSVCGRTQRGGRGAKRPEVDMRASVASRPSRTWSVATDALTTLSDALRR